MEWVAIVMALVLVQYQVFGMLVGWARSKYNCPAPAISGNPVFERYYRVQANTGEQLLLLLPGMLIYGYYGNPMWAALAGVVFIIGRVVYLLGYVKDPGKRSLGFMIGFFPVVFVLLGSIVVVLRSLLQA